MGRMAASISRNPACLARNVLPSCLVAVLPWLIGWRKSLETPTHIPTMPTIGRSGSRIYAPIDESLVMASCLALGMYP